MIGTLGFELKMLAVGFLEKAITLDDMVAAENSTQQGTQKQYR